MYGKNPKENITPAEIARIENLAITKRRINSSKKIGEYKKTYGE